MSPPQSSTSLFQSDAFRKMLQKRSYISSYLRALLNSFKERMMNRPKSHLGVCGLDNIFRKILPKRSYMSRHYLGLLNSFEDKLTRSFNKLMETSKDNVLSLSWMKLAFESLCETNSAITTLMVDLGLSGIGVDGEWCSVYQANARSLMDMCSYIDFEIMQLNQVSDILKSALQNVTPNTTDFAAVQLSLLAWQNPVHEKKLALEKFSAVMESIFASLELPSIKNLDKGKVMMRAMYGYKLKTLLISSIITSAFSKSTKKLVEIHIPETLPWADAFTRLQSLVNKEMRTQFADQGALKELQDIIYLLDLSQAQNTLVKPEVVESIVSDMKKAAEKLSNALYLLATELITFQRTVVFTLTIDLVCDAVFGN